MRKKLFQVTALCCAMTFTACGGNSSNATDASTSQTDTTMTAVTTSSSLPTGTFEGTLPCADCEGIQTQLVLRADSTYDLRSQYLGEKDGVFETSGVYHQKADKLIELVTPSSGEKTYYKVLDESSIMLSDSLGTENQGELAPHYVLKKK